MSPSAGDAVLVGQPIDLVRHEGRLVVLIIGENPVEAMWIMLNGAVGSLKGWGYLLYYATNFIFTGLAVAVAFHAGLFNIGGEGQAYMAGVGAAAVGLGLDFLPWPIVLPLAVLASAAMGAFWAWIPGVLQARRGSHIVITTIMFNFIAASLVGYLINYWFRPVGKMAVESREITGAYIMSFREVARKAPLEASESRKRWAPPAAKEAEALGLEVAIMNGANLAEFSHYIDGEPFVGTVIS